MHQIQAPDRATPDVRFVSFTVDPAHDTPPVLAEYAKHFKSDPARWYFLTGDQARLNDLALNGFKLNSVDGSLTHSTRFVLVDAAAASAATTSPRGRLPQQPDARHPPTGAGTHMTRYSALGECRPQRAPPRCCWSGATLLIRRKRIADAPQGDDHGVRHVVPVPDVLSGVPRAGGLGAVSRSPVQSARSTLSILATHTVLAAAVPVLAIITLRRGLAGEFDRHRRIARWTLPIWLYVSVTGVVVYLMLYHL